MSSRLQAGQDVDHAAGHVGRGQDLAQRDGRQGPGLGGQQHDGVARHERRREPADQAEQRRRLGGDDPNDAGRFGDREVEVRCRDRVRRPEHLGDLVSPAGVPDPAVDGAIDGGRRLGHRQPFGRDDLGDELVAAALHQLRDPVQDLAAVHGRPVCPAGERLARGPHRIAQVLARRPARVGERSAIGARDDVRAAALRPRERAADVQLVGLADLDPSGRGRDRARRPSPWPGPARACATPPSDPPGGRRRTGRACRPRGRSPIPCSHRTATSGRTD